MAQHQRGYPSEIFALGYAYDSQTAAYRTGLSGADTLTTAGILAVTEFKLYGKQTITVSARFSNTGANCKIRVAHINKTDPEGSATDTTINTIKGYSTEFTITAGSTTYEGSYFPAPDQFFDGEGSTSIRVLITGATSAGTVDLWVGSY